jgi:exosome complex RNA-binding protein Rrp42 (RNase PH superfamily)
MIETLINENSVRLPTLSVDPNGEDILASVERPVKLQLNLHPVAVTFGIMEEYVTTTTDPLNAPFFILSFSLKFETMY